MDPNDLPDRVHIDALRDALHRPDSRAAVLVGAGMSRNADRMSAAVRPFPLWWDIAPQLQLALQLDKERDRTPPPRLGQMYENTFGRDRLDDLLLDLIPDGKYEPSHIHERLLLLPWSDIFTTNYDTLLERTRVRTPQMKYEVVYTSGDLTRAERPRIVKLHGSFPAHRPFIFTEEDYRKYPTQFAPFVNLVRQSAMENILCLIGFSGDDPNFLQWAGWIRDQLGGMAPRMYLCGVFDLTTPQRAYYQHMQVVPVDLGPLFPNSAWGGERYSAAIRWLIETLHNGQTSDCRYWPRQEAETRAEVLPKPYPALLGPRRAPVLRPTRPDREQPDLNDEQLRRLMTTWRHDRSSYPRWPVCPEPARAMLWMESGSWLFRLQQPQGAATIGALALVERGNTLREIAWRCQTLLLPLPRTLPPLITTWLNELNPRPKLIALPDALTPDNAEERGKTGLPWSHLTEVWVDLAFALVRHGWQFQDAQMFEHWIGKLEKVADSRGDWRALWHYEKCWQHLVRLENRLASEVATRWPEDPTLPYWEAKRAAVLAELGQHKEATKIAHRALERVRLGRNSNELDLQSLSEEGWILRLLNRVSLAMTLSPFDFAYVERDRRLDDLRREYCDPQDDIVLRERALLDVKPGGQSVTRGFDPGTAVIWHRAGPSDRGEWVLINTLHDGALPFSLSTNTTLALREAWQSSPWLSLGLLIRAGASNELSETKPLAGLLGRASVGRMDQSQVDQLYSWLYPVLQEALGESLSQFATDVGERSATRRLTGCIEVLSRLAFRLNEGALSALFEFACAAYGSQVFQADFGLQSCLGQLFRRLFFAASSLQLRSWLPSLLRLPLVGEAGTDFTHGHLNLDPWSYITSHDLSILGSASEPDVVAQVERLIRLVGSVDGADGEARWRASLRLSMLLYGGTLTPEQKRAFHRAVWVYTNEDGYPAGIGFHPWVLLLLSDDETPATRAKIALFLTRAELKDRYDEKQWIQAVEVSTEQPAQRPMASLSPRITWTPHEAHQLLAVLSRIWLRHSSHVHQLLVEPDFGSRLCTLLSSAIAPFLSTDDEAVRRETEGLLTSMAERGVCTTAGIPALMLMRALDETMAANRLYRAIVGANTREVRDGAIALTTWIGLSHVSRLSPPPPWLLEVLLSCAEAMRKPGLIHILDALSVIVERQEMLQESQMKQLVRILGRIRETMALERMREDLTWDDDLGFDSDERVAILAEASGLTAKLSRFYSDPQLLPMVTTWRDFAAAHPLPEVRRPWDEHSTVDNDSRVKT